MQRDRSWQVLSERELLDRRWLRVREQHVRLPNGHEMEEFYVLDSPDWAFVLPVTDDGNVVLVRQYRHGAKNVSLELPAGVIEPNEAGLDGAKRELLEETGYAAKTWYPLSARHPEPARHSSRAHFYVATGAYLAEPPTPEAGELLDLVIVPQAELGERIDNGEIIHWVHVAGILLAARSGFLELGTPHSSRLP